MYILIEKFKLNVLSETAIATIFEDHIVTQLVMYWELGILVLPYEICYHHFKVWRFWRYTGRALFALFTVTWKIYLGQKNGTIFDRWLFTIFGGGLRKNRVSNHFIWLLAMKHLQKPPWIRMAIICWRMKLKKVVQNRNNYKFWPLLMKRYN